MTTFSRRSFWANLRFGIGLALVFTVVDWFSGRDFSMPGIVGLMLTNLLLGILISVVGSWIIQRVIARKNRFKAD